MKRESKKDYDVFVFASNQAGIHGAGSALAAVKFHGAVYGIGEGPQGDSYAIPTKDHRLRTLPLADIQLAIHKFIDYARRNPTVRFHVVKIGCGLAGYRDEHIIPFFAEAPDNCLLPEGWR